MNFGGFKIFTDQGDLHVSGHVGEFIGVHIDKKTRAPTVTMLHTGTSINSLFEAAIAIAHLSGDIGVLTNAVDRLEAACPIAFYALFDLPWGFSGPFQSTHTEAVETLRKAAKA